MTTFVHVPASRITGDLEPMGQRPGADSGDPQLGLLRFDTDGTVRAGVWESRPGGWPVVERADTETCYILSGRALVTDAATGETFEISAGDVIVQPQGWSGRWDVKETIRKVYSIGL
ncbi:cupin domain-containing protein [Streptomyces massasporeus]|uniref:cupin domain-containing protein n=1 Tax=Streptomyces massasporeus TaxID=67324 RepID=UPI00167B09B9|nr:cupin domain-containing protein [Streptomyces massasporeus]GGV85109.1 cupin [Streptomyces massasporeus]